MGPNDFIMSGLRTIAACLVAISASVASGRADTDLTAIFAGCAGRFSAAVEHAWLMQDPLSDEIEARRRAFLSLLDAMGAGEDADALARRIEAKAAQAALLRDASFGTDKDRAAWAESRATAQLAHCRQLLLDG